MTYANVMSTVAVFIALGGTSYAAVKLPKGSVGATQIKADAVTSAAIRDGAVTAQDLAPGAAGSGPRGPRGQTGPSGPAGATGPIGPTGAGVSLEAWRPMTLVNDWVNYNSPAGPYFNAAFRKDTSGRVELRGFIARSTDPARGVIAVLPDGYRPKRPVRAVTSMGNGAIEEPGIVVVQDDGQVIWGSGVHAQANFTSLDGIIFSTD